MAVVVVLEWERVVHYGDGRLVGVLGPGRHRYRERGAHLVTVDLRPSVLTVPGQQLITADGLTVQVSVHAVWAVTDPVRYVGAAQQPMGLLYIALQDAIRDLTAARTLDQLVAERTTLAEPLREAVAAEGERLGVAVERVSVKDVMLPAELRRAATEVVLARERGRAELERARAEAAALRSLANTARLLEDHPALLRLRTLQAAESPGTTVVLTPPA